MKYVAFLETNASGTGAEAIRKLQKAGYRVLFLTNERPFYETLELNPLKLADEVIFVNTSCISSIINALKEYSLGGVVAFDDYRLITAAFVADYYNLPHPNIDGLLNCRFKNLTRKKITDSNVEFSVYNLDAFPEYNDLIYPCVVKPCDDSGSVGVHICRNVDDVRFAVEVLRAKRVNARGYKLANNYLVEEWIDGNEYSAELIWETRSQSWRLLGFTGKHITSGCYAVETGHDFPVTLPNANYAEQRILSWLEQSHLNGTVAHVEFKIGSRGISLIEINPRPGGDMIHKLCELATGIDVVEHYLSMLVIGYQPCHREAVTPAASIRFIIPKEGGTVVKIESPEPNNTVEMSVMKQPPCTIKAVASSYDRLGFVITKGISADASARYAQAFVDQTKVCMEEPDKQTENADWLLLLGNSAKGASTIRKLGYRVVMIPDRATATGDCVLLCDAVFPAKLDDFSSVEQAWFTAVSVYGRPAAILNFSDNGQLVCERLREDHGYKGNGATVAMTVIDKALMRECLQQSPELAVDFIYGFGYEIISQAEQRLNKGKRYVLKPVDGVGSKHVYFISTIAELNQIEILADDISTRWIMEEEIIGQEYSVESVTCDGETHILGITQKHINQHAVETGHLYPAFVNDNESQCIKDTVCKALSLIGVRWGATHTEVISGGNGIYIIETHLRPGGDEIPELLRLVENVCQYELSVEAVVCQKVSPYVRTGSGSAAIKFFTHNHSAGYLQKIEFPYHEDIYQLKFNYQPGVMVPQMNSSFNRLGHIICKSPVDQAYNLCLNYEKDVIAEINLQ